jgi:hypothetical protein
MKNSENVVRPDLQLNRIFLVYVLAEVISKFLLHGNEFIIRIVNNGGTET